MAFLVKTFPQAFLEVLHHSLQHVGRNCCHFVPDVLFQVKRCPWFLFVHLALEISPEEEVLRLGTLSFRWILKCRRNSNWVKMTELLFLKIVSTAKARCSTDQRSMATEMLWVSLEERSRTNSPRQRFHSQLCYQIVRYFCRTLYKDVGSTLFTVIQQLTYIEYWALSTILRNLPANAPHLLTQHFILCIFTVMFQYVCVYRPACLPAWLASTDFILSISVHWWRYFM